MTWVITSLCRDCLDMSCVEVCPVDCIVQYQGEATPDGQGADSGFPNQLFIDPEECINCGVCEPECPWEAIFEDEQVPDVFRSDVAINASIVKLRDEFQVPEKPDGEIPTPDQIKANKEKWSYDA